MATDETSPLLPASEQDQSDPNDNTMSTLLWKTGAVFGATAVGLGAFGAHGLKKHISDPNKLANWSTAAQYQVRFYTYFQQHGQTKMMLTATTHCSSSTPSPSSWPATTPSPAPSSPPA